MASSACEDGVPLLSVHPDRHLSSQKLPQGWPVELPCNGLIERDKVAMNNRERMYACLTQLDEHELTIIMCWFFLHDR